jgi:hypothetical protein
MDRLGTILFAICQLTMSLQAYAEESPSKAVETVQEKTPQKRFVFATPGVLYPNCSYRLDPNVYNKSPWLKELQGKLESAWGAKEDFHSKNNNAIGCQFDLDRSGKFVNLQPCPANVTTTDATEQGEAFDVIRRIGSITPPQGAIAASNKITICVEFMRYPHYALSQRLTLVK